jgi:hypothetical protein
VSVRLDSLPAGALFLWANVKFSAQDRFEKSASGEEHRGVVYEQDLSPHRDADGVTFGQTLKGTLGLMPIDEEVELL